MAEEEIGARLALKDRRKFSREVQTASKDVDGLGTASSKTGSKLGSLGKKAGAASALVVAAVGAMSAKGVMAFSSFEGSMNEVFTLLPSASEAAMAGMTSDVKTFSKEFGVLPREVVPALYQALSAGVPKDNVFEFLEASQMAARGGVTELSTAVSGISGVVNAYGADVISAAAASDLMFTTVRLGTTTFGALASQLGDVTPIAGALGVTFGEVSAAMAASTAITGNTMKSATGLKSMLAELGKEGQHAADIFTDMAGESFTDFIAGGGTLVDALNLMKTGAEESGMSVLDLFGGIEAGSTALQLAGSAKFASNLDEMTDSAGATQAAFERMETGVAPVLNRLKANLSVGLINIGEKLAPAVEDISLGVLAISQNMDSLASFSTAVGTVFGWEEDSENTRRLQATLEGLLAASETVFDGLSAALRNVGDVSSEVLGFLSDDSILAKVSLVALGTVATGILTAQVIMWTNAGVAALRSAAKQVAAWTMTRVSAITSAATTAYVAGLYVASWIGMGAAAVAQGARIVATWILMSARAIVSGAVAVAQGALVVASWAAMGARAVASGAVILIQGGLVAASWIFMGITAMANGIMIAAAWLLALGPVGLVIAALVAVGAVFAILWMKSEKFRDIVTGAINGVWSGIKFAYEWVKNNWPLLLAILTGPFGLAVLAITKNFDTIKSVFKGVINWFIDKWNDLSFTLPSVNIPGIGTIGGMTLSTPDIPRLHEGGTTVSGGMVNMKPGEEMVFLPPAASVVPMTDNVRSMGEAMSGDGAAREPVVVQVVLDRKVLAEAVYQHTGDKLARI
jgi:TP901 family phage tail tape measure protein